MKTVTVRGVSLKASFPKGKTDVSTADFPVSLTTGAVPSIGGRLAIDNELARIKYCV